MTGLCQSASDNHHNLQIHASKQAKSISVPKQAPSAVATVLVLEGSDPAVTPAQVRDALKRLKNDDGSVEKLGTPPKPKTEENIKK